MIPPRLQTPDTAKRLRLIALAQYELLGYEAATADDIAAAAGVSRRSLFRYFPTLEDILFSDHHVEYLPLVAQYLWAGHGEPTHVAGRALGLVLDGLERDRDFVSRRARVVGQSSALKDREKLWLGMYQSAVSGHLRAQSQGPRDAMFAEIVAAALMAALSEVIERWLSGEGEENPQGLFSELVDEIAESMFPPAPPVRTASAPGETPNVIVIGSDLTAKEITDLIEGAR